MINHYTAFAVLVFSFFPRSQAAEPNVKILMVSSKPDHPYASHMYAFECSLLAKALRNTPGVQAITLSAWPPDAETLAGVRSIVFYSSPAGEVVLSPSNRQVFLNLMGQQVGYVAIHWSTGVGYSKLSDTQTLRDDYKSVLGGWFRRPPCGVQIGRSNLQKTNPTHPISRGWDGWQIHDEFYLNPVLHERAQSLLEVEVDEGTHVVGWTFQRPDKGRSVGITLGHFHHNFAREDFRRILVNSILWSANVPVPHGGADVDVPANDLKLAPKSD